jgi:hypothetical protein
VSIMAQIIQTHNNIEFTWVKICLTL